MPTHKGRAATIAPTLNKKTAQELRVYAKKHGVKQTKPNGDTKNKSELMRDIRKKLK